MSKKSEAMRELSPERRKAHRKLRALMEEMTDPRAGAIADKLCRARLVIDSMMDLPDEGPVWQAALKAESDGIKKLRKTPCASDDVFFQNQAFLTYYTLLAYDEMCDDYHAPLDLLLKYLNERWRSAENQVDA
jgi:hypothetical protein